jgi:hypothetical protein
VHNISHEIKGDQLIITIDIGSKTLKSAPPSSTGKTLLVASTGGAMPLATQGASLTMAVNVMARR